MRFRIDYISLQRKAVFIWARQLDAGEFKLSSSAKLGSVALRPLMGMPPRAVRPDGSPDTEIFCFLPLTRTEAQKVSVGEIVELVGYQKLQPKEYTINCEEILSEEEFWGQYISTTNPESAEYFGRNTDAFRHALNGGVGYPGRCRIIFVNTQSLNQFREGAFYQALCKIEGDLRAVSKPLVTIELRP